MMKSIADIRQEYASRTFLEKDAAVHPMQQFEAWFEEALHAELTEPNAMTLATASSDGFPSARIVLLKGIDPDGFRFFTNYKSFKAQQLTDNPKACLVFFWKEVERQVRITGLVTKLSPQDNDDYFNSRPVGSRIGAIASPQSEVVANRNWLDEQYRLKAAEPEEKIKRPDYWGGYLLKPIIVEFWQGRPGRLHDRLQYSLQGNGDWKIERLAP